MGHPHMERIYLRLLPGGGFVAIDVARLRRLIVPRYRGWVVLERRSRSRRVGPPLVLATAEGSRITSVLHELFPLAQSNAALACHLIDRGPTHQRERGMAGDG